MTLTTVITLSGLPYTLNRDCEGSILPAHNRPMCPMASCDLLPPPIQQLAVDCEPCNRAVITVGFYQANNRHEFWEFAPRVAIVTASAFRHRCGFATM